MNKPPLDPRHRLRIKTLLYANLIAAVMLVWARYLHTLEFFVAQLWLVLFAVVLAAVPWMIRDSEWFAALRGHIAIPLTIVACSALCVGIAGFMMPIGQTGHRIEGFGGCWLTVAALWILLVVWMGFRHRGEP